MSNSNSPRPILARPAFWIFLLGMTASILAGLKTSPRWEVKSAPIEEGAVVDAIPIPESASSLWAARGSTLSEVPEVDGEPISKELIKPRDGEGLIELTAARHWGVFSLLPAFFAVAMCFALREPISALACGVISSSLVMARWDILNDSLIPAIGTAKGATILILYLWLLGGMLGIWARSGAARAFADWASRTLVRGPISAKLVTWFLGIIFFQGGTLSTVLVGTTVKPIADRQKVSHEELSYVVDSTASPIAILLPFNAWPVYVQGLIFLPGVAFLATDTDRIKFFFGAIPLSFYAIFAVLFTLLLSLEKLPFVTKGMRESIRRARAGEGLDRPDAQPLAAPDFGNDDPPYKPSVAEFLIPLGLILGIAIGTYIVLDSPKVLWAFGIAMLTSLFIALVRGMRLVDAIQAIVDGMKGVVGGSVVLLLAVALGLLSQQVGAGVFLAELLGDSIPTFALPAILFVVAIFVAFSTGTSWGTFALGFPLGLPLALAAAQGAGIENTHLYVSICFAAILNGAVFGDQCSPISDTTVLSSLSTGCDVMDHVKTQLYPSCVAASLAVVLWTVMATFFVG